MQKRMKINETGEISINHTDVCHTPDQFWASKDVDRIIAIINKKTMLNLKKEELKDHHSAFAAAREVFEQMPLVTRMKEFEKLKKLLDAVQEEVRKKDEERKKKSGR